MRPAPVGAKGQVPVIHREGDFAEGGVGENEEVDDVSDGEPGGMGRMMVPRVRGGAGEPEARDGPNHLRGGQGVVWSKASGAWQRT